MSVRVEVKSICGSKKALGGVHRCCVIAALCLGSLTCNAQCNSAARLNKWERGQFIEAAFATRSEIAVQVLAESGCGERMLTKLRNLGIKIDYADTTVGYVMFEISKETVLDTLDIKGVAYAYTNNNLSMYESVPSTNFLADDGPRPVPSITIPYPRVATTMPENGPYFATDEIGLTDFWKHHQWGDGRGVRVGVEDEGFDLLHPALQQALDASGRTVPKVADIGTLRSVAQGNGWVKFGPAIRTEKSTLDAAGQTWTVPGSGTYRVGIFRQDLTLGPPNNSLSKRVSLAVGVLWSERENRVWVDSNGDGNFANEHALTDYGQSNEIGWFGSNRDGADNRIPFGVKIDQSRAAVYLRIGSGHGTLVAGPLAANTLTGGLFDGAAPAAQLIDEDFSRKYRLGAIVKLAGRSDVDLVNHSGAIGAGGYAGEQQGMGEFEQHVLKRLIETYKKPIVAYTAAPGAIHVMDYTSSEMLRRNRQVAAPYRDTTNSSVWPLIDGLVNLVLAPSANLTTQSRYEPIDLTGPDGRKHAYSDEQFDPPAPDGYAIGANPSPTIPIVSGVLADLISEAKREHIRYNAIRLNNAIFTGTRLLESFPLSQQGYGLINAAQSWDQLAKMSKADDRVNPVLTSFTVARLEDGRNIEVQGFHSDLAKPGEKLEGEIFITRHGGYASGRKYAFSLRGNNGSYELLDREGTLERDKPVRVRFRTNGASGSNIVFLELRDVAADVVMEDVPLSVRVPNVPEKIAPGLERYESNIPPLRSERKYIRLGEKVQAARYVMRIPYTGPWVCCSSSIFPGYAEQETTAPNGKLIDPLHHIGAIATLESLCRNDHSGIQQVYWENRARPEYATQYDPLAPDAPIDATLTVKSYAVAIAKMRPNALSLSNQLANVEGHVELYNANFTNSEVQGHGKHATTEIEREVPANLFQWRLRVSGWVKGRHLDAYLLDCTGKSGCSIMSQQEITEKGASLVVDKPKAGAWRIVIRDREEVPSAPIFRLSEAQLVFTQPTTEEKDAEYKTGEKWTVSLPEATRYAGFRIAGTSGVASEKEGLLIAMTPLLKEAP
jgi:hypothetical protein